MDSLILSVAIKGFMLSLAAEGKSVHTLADYRSSLGKLQAFLGNGTEVAEISREDVREFMAGLSGSLAPKSRKNVHTGLSSFWTWAVAEGYAPEHIMRSIAAPRAPLPVIEPLTEQQVQAMVRACVRSRPWVSPSSRRETSTRRVTGQRDRALVLFLLDTGIRASELCHLRVQDMDLEKGHAIILKGKGGQQRLVYFGKRSRQALWRYWATRIDVGDTAPAFATVLDGERPLTRDVLYRLIARIGERAGIPGVHPHLFRHTCAITFLRNGGDLFILQALLGHSSLDMVRRYARIADSDTERAHEMASPVDNWRL